MPGFRVHDEVGGRRTSEPATGALYFLQTLHERFDCERRALGDDRSGSAAHSVPGWACVSRWKVPPTLYSKTGGFAVFTRDWREDEPSISVNGRPLAAALFDFGSHAYSKARVHAAMGESTVFLISHLRDERGARLWCDVLQFGENYLGLPRGCLRASVRLAEGVGLPLVESMLFELREHIAGVVVPPERLDIEDICRKRGAASIAPAAGRSAIPRGGPERSRLTEL